MSDGCVWCGTSVKCCVSSWACLREQVVVLRQDGAGCARITRAHQGPLGGLAGLLHCAGWVIDIISHDAFVGSILCLTTCCSVGAGALLKRVRKVRAARAKF